MILLMEGPHNIKDTHGITHGSALGKAISLGTPFALGILHYARVWGLSCLAPSLGGKHEHDIAPYPYKSR